MPGKSPDLLDKHTRWLLCGRMVCHHHASRAASPSYVVIINFLSAGDALARTSRTDACIALLHQPPPESALNQRHWALQEDYASQFAM